MTSDEALEVCTSTYGPEIDQSQHAKSVSHIALLLYYIILYCIVLYCIALYCIELPLSTLQALQRDITKLQRKLDSLNETGAYMVGHADQQYCSKLRDQLEDVNIRWEEVMRTATRQKDNLVAALEKYEKLSRDMKEMTHWIIQTERSIAEDDKDIEKGEIAKEKVEHYRVSHKCPTPIPNNNNKNIGFLLIIY